MLICSSLRTSRLTSWRWSRGFSERLTFLRTPFTQTFYCLRTSRRLVASSFSFRFCSFSCSCFCVFAWLCSSLMCMATDCASAIFASFMNLSTRLMCPSISMSCVVGSVVWFEALARFLSYRLRVAEILDTIRSYLARSIKFSLPLEVCRSSVYFSLAIFSERVLFSSTELFKLEISFCFSFLIYSYSLRLISVCCSFSYHC
mmetsp:Transcript_10675/g.13243  ORF Transcript_10675/g.13243 Transcript_10675/m.13243 type:complete len:202 (-) Transcript_10675:1102-1707(-)